MRRIFFDVDDTLYNMMDPFSRAFHSLFGARYQETDLQRLFVLSRRYSDEVFADTVKGRMTMEAMYIYRIQRACQDMGIIVSDEEALLFQQYYEENQGRIQMPQITEDLLNTLIKSSLMYCCSSETSVIHARFTTVYAIALHS